MPSVTLLENIKLQPLEVALVQSVYSGYANLILEKEFLGGFGGTRVFLILPVKPSGASDARVVTKIGAADNLRHERDNYEAHVARSLPFSVAQVRNYHEQNGQAALNYVFAGGETLGQTVSLEDYYQSHTASQVIETLSGLLDKALGARWYRASWPLHRSFREEYGRHLPADIELEKIVQTVFSGLLVSQGDQVRFPGISETYPHPLQEYPGLLNTLLAGRQSLVHGDLHLRNVLVDERGKGWLIDFAKVQERHNLFDFIKLETYIRLMVLAAAYGAFSWSEYLHFEQALTDGDLGLKAVSPTNPCLAKAYDVIRAVRQIAQSCLSDPRNFKEEYLTPLFFYSLAILKYYPSNGVVPTQLVFLTACVAGRYLLPNASAEGAEMKTRGAASAQTVSPMSGSNAQTAVKLNRRTLYKVILEKFNLEEIELLCKFIEQNLAEDGITLQVSLEMAGGESKEAKINKLIGFLERRGYLAYLFQAVKAQRPDSALGDNGVA